MQLVLYFQMVAQTVVFQFNVPAGFDVTIMGLNTTNYQIFCNATSTTAPTFADQ